MKHLAVVKTLAILLLIGACTQAPAPDPVFTGQESVGTTIPVGANTVSVDEFKKLSQLEGFTWVNPKKQAQQKQARAAQFKADEAEIKLLATQFPKLGGLLKPSPELKILPDGNYVATLEDRNGQPFDVITQGAEATYRGLLKARAKGQSSSNQLKIYTQNFASLSPALQSGLATPQSLSAASTETILAARAELAKRLEANPGLLEDASPLVVATSGLRLQSEVNPNAKPANFPANADAEEGKGKGIDRGGLDCSPTNFDTNGLYQNFWWRQKYYHTSVKSQGSRGSCVGFALTAALEARIAIEKNRWVNLSEQFLWSKIAGEWDEREFGDGASTNGMGDEFFDSQYALPLEQTWNYNKSSNRKPKKDDPPQDFYTFSCDNYDEFCSNTSHQMENTCTTLNGVVYCGYFRPPATGERFKQSEQTNIYDWSSFSLPIAEIRNLLKNGQTMTASFDVTKGFKAPVGGYVGDNSNDEYLGGHAIQIVGFITSSRIVNHPNISQSVKNKAADSGGGYFVLKNSWGYCGGDAGYYYVSVNWADDHFNSINYFETNPSAAFKTVPNIPPSIEITAPTTTTFNQEFNNITFSANATDTDGSISSIKWASSLEGNLGTGESITVALGTAGSHTITATATDNAGASNSTQKIIQIVSQAPVVTITAPSNNQNIYRNQAFPFEGFAEDGILDVPCNQLEWTSNKAGEGPWAGCTPSITFTSNGARTITLTATDETNKKGSKSVSFTVVDKPVNAPPSVQITYPKANTPYSYFPTDKVRLGYSIVPAGQNTAVWKGTKGTKTVTITPKTDARFRYFIPNEVFPGSPCGQLYNLKLDLTVTDANSVPASDSVTILVIGPPC